MANRKTGAQRYNDRMDEIFARSKELNEKYHGKDSFGSGDHRSDAMKKSHEKKEHLARKMKGGKKIVVDYGKTNQGKKEAELHRQRTEKMFRD